MTRYTLYSLLTLLVSSSSVYAASTPALCKKGGPVVVNCSSEIDITCSLANTGEDCDSYFERTPFSKCKKIDVIINYQYCNCNSGNGEDIVVFPEKTYGLYRSQPVIDGADVKELQPNTCGTFEVTKRVNTCQGFAKAEMSWNGYNKKYGPENSVCWAFDRDNWNFPKPTPTPAPTVTQPTAPDTEICKLTTVCLLEGGTSCVGNVARQSGADCSNPKPIPVTMVLKYCNTHDSLTLSLNQDNDKCFIKLNQSNLSMDKSPVPSGGCHEEVITEYLDTCLDKNIIEARVEGTFEGSKKWCVATDTLVIDTIETPPTNPPTKKVSGKGKGKNGKYIRK